MKYKVQLKLIVDVMESKRDKVPSPVETEERCPREPLTVETSTSAPVLDEMDNYAANEVCKVSGNEEDIAELKVPMKVLQRHQVCGFFFTVRLQLNQAVRLDKYYISIELSCILIRFPKVKSPSHVLVI